MKSDAARELRELADHCLTCPTCRANPAEQCATSRALLRTWSAARRGTKPPAAPSRR